MTEEMMNLRSLVEKTPDAMGIIHQDIKPANIMILDALATDLQHDADGVRNGHHRGDIERLAQARAVNKLHGDEGLALVKGEVVDGHYVGMNAAGGSLGLAPETPEVVSAVDAAHQFSRDQLYGDRPADVGIVSLVNLAHATNADQIFDDIATDSSWDGLHDYYREGTPIMRLSPAS